MTGSASPPATGAPEICQTHLPLRPWADERLRRLPGLNPVAPGEWLLVDDAYGAQMAYRAALIADKGAAVLRLDPAARPAADELLEAVLAELDDKPGYARAGERVSCPDGRVVTLERADPLGTCARLVQEDLVLLERPEDADEHLLTGAVLCFPASWTLDQKFLRPLTRIHRPVPSYDGDIARRVQRLFDGIQPGRPIWRANYLVYADPNLHQPRREDDPRAPAPGGRRWLRVERQALARLPESRAVVFSIHTYVVPLASLSAEDQAALAGTAQA